ncbi:MinD/ParA family protein [Pseudonocardia sp. DSM 110487]|uniref:MinD/ParA family ATP-binding protein n=1 Tax=Pseudonocardia sp. DSM 110487 TaxID=2865833 RepID=UPI002107702B|nr:MinD/ParA family protein [Pseudonocardia sp. DSM 110487]
MPKRSFAPPDSGTARQEPTPQSPPPADVPTEQVAAAEPVEPEPPREEAVQEAPPVAEPVVPAPLPPRPVVDARPHTASELTEYTIVRRRSDKPGSGWRRAVHVASVGLVNPGIGPAEQRRQELALRIRCPLPGPRQIAVASMKGGVGKTTVTAMLGLMLAEHRGDRIVALDANPDAGTLADRLTGRTDSTVRDLLDSLGSVGSLSDIARFTTLSGRLQVLASEQDPARGEAFDRAEYERVCAVLSRFYNVVVTDSGTGMVHSAMDGTLALANGLVIVGSHTVDGASRASKTLDWLVAHGHHELVERAVVVLSQDRTSPEIDGQRLVAHFQARSRAVVLVPRDPHLATGSRIELDKLRPTTSDAFLELAALVADDFGNPPPVRQN